LADEHLFRWKLGEKGVAVAELVNVVKRLEKLKIGNEG